MSDLTEPELEAVARLTRATCAHLHKVAVETGYLVRPRKDPGQYRVTQVWPIVYAAYATGLIQEVAT